MQTTFFVDIDQTISTGYVGQDLKASIAYYRRLGLQVPESVKSWPALFQLPDVARLHEALPGAQTGVRQLAGGGALFYATARKADIHQITLDWLAREGFPSPDQVIFVEGVAEKLVAIVEHVGPLVLIDDRWCQILAILEQYGRRRSLADLLDRLTLVAFGASADELPGSSVVPVVPLSDWSLIADVFKVIHEVVSTKGR
jgi:hypothetical protein